MSNEFSETKGRMPTRRMGDTVAYSARMQEAMRYDKLSIADYRLVMTIMYAISHGLTEEKWQEEQQKTVSILIQQPPDAKTPHADAASRYEQTVACFKDLALWPW